MTATAALAATRNITPGDIRFIANEAWNAQQRTCPVCLMTGSTAPKLAVPALEPPHEALTLLECQSCRSLFYEPPGIRDFDEISGARKEFARFYAEAGGGVWETIWPLLVAADRGSFLDVGCGFGFAVDFWQTTARGDAVGVELAEYGAMGALALGVTIHRELLDDCKALVGRTFDIVYASEVVEHVERPGAFVNMLARRVNAEGVLILTTPAAAFVAPKNTSSSLLGALAPGFHGFLLSAQAFEQLVRDAGFAHVEVRRFTERQIAWASRRPLKLDFNDARMRAVAFDYMVARLGTLEQGSAEWQGYAYRLLRDFTNLGRLVEAHALERQLREAMHIADGFSLDRLDSVVERYAAARTLAEVGSVGAFFLPCYLYYAATLAERVDRDYARARRCYGAAAEMAKSAARISVAYFGEAASIYWPARIGDALLALALGDDSHAATLVELAEHGHQLTAEHAFSLAEPGRVETLLPAVVEDLEWLGRFNAAAMIAGAYANYLARAHNADPRAPAYAQRAQALAGKARGAGKLASTSISYNFTTR